jgi:hypothetical protein
LVRFSVFVVAPEYVALFVTAVQVVPPSVLTSQAKLVALADVTLKDVLAPAQMVWLDGGKEIAGPEPGLIVYVTDTVWFGAPDAVPVTVIL